MTTLPADVRAFLDAYRDAFDALDGEAVAALYAEPSGIVDGERCTQGPTSAPIRANMVALCAQYRGNGFRSATFAVTAFLPLGDDCAVADLAWTIEWTSEPPSRFGTAYHLVRRRQGWRVLLCTAYGETKLARPPAGADGGTDGGIGPLPTSSRAHPLPERIDTERLRLRRPRLDDAAGIFRSYAQDGDVARFMVWTPHASADETRAFVAECIDAWGGGDRLPYVITDRGADAPIGMIEARIAGATVDIGYVLERARWGRGLMPEAVRALGGAALARPSVFRCQATCDVDNTASQRVLEKAGFVREGRLARCTVHPNLSPEPRPCYLYAACR